MPDDLIHAVAEGSNLLELDVGEVIIEEGSDSEEMYIVVEGLLVVTKLTDDKAVELARLGPGQVVGEIALLDDAPRTATVKAIESSLVIEVPVEAFEVLLGDSTVVRRLFRTVTTRLREIEDTLRHEERMAALGRMAAQLMHELNNPAAAVARSTQELNRIYQALGEESEILASAHGETNLPEPIALEEALSSLDRGEREDQMADWLGAVPVQGAWDIAPALVDRGWTVELLEEASANTPDNLRGNLLRWIGLRAAAEQVISEIGIGTGRISELVRVVKDYSYLDQAPIQEIDPMSGIRDTLVLLKHKLRDIDVVIEVDDDLHEVEAPGRDLNQVWTNLIDNAADAMDGSGTLTIRARNTPAAVEISVIDTGPGIKPDILERVFDPFFTTKEPGKGTGLGLHTVQSLVGRTGGDISVSSSSSGTTFTVVIPAVI
ncbi:MAG TPA: ATP-binding protein [Acidimicrobiia bacterium]